MRIPGRLFWKILLGFWLIFLLITQALWVGFILYGNRHEPPEESIARRFIHLQMVSAESALKTGGLPALQALMAQWPDGEQTLLVAKPLTPADSKPGAAAENAAFFADKGIRPATPAGDKETGTPPRRGPSGNPALPPLESIANRQVTAADGRQYLLRYDFESLRRQYHNGHRSNILNIPSPLFWLGMTVGLLFSLLLAWNLTRPMRQLRRAFARVSLGDLTVRLFPVMRRRHDEITEVAKDFDAMAERLQVLVAAREALLHDISHELRTPLARLQMAIGLAHQNPANVDTSLARIKQEAERLDRMVGELLALSRAEHQGMLAEEYFDLLGLVEAVVNDARYEAQLTRVTITLTAQQPADYTVKGNAEMMRRAVENIVRNALRFSLPGQKIAVKLAVEDRLLTISVADQGPGIAEEKLSSIFDPFVRVNSPQSGKGYGLGLAITRKVLLAHGGSVDAHNGREGGLQIHLRLPHWQ